MMDEPTAARMHSERAVGLILAVEAHALLASVYRGQADLAAAAAAYGKVASIRGASPLITASSIYNRMQRFADAAASSRRPFLT
jgi:hypothetical protein